MLAAASFQKSNGCCGTAADLFALPYSHRPELYRGFFEAEAKALLRAFFQALRA